MITHLTGNKCYFEYREKEKEIFGSCKVDHANYPACYNRKVRSIKKGWAALVSEFHDEMTMYQATQVLDRFNLRMRHFCKMD